MSENIDNLISEIENLLYKKISIQENVAKKFFKTGIGEYAFDDNFLGIRVGDVRSIANLYRDIINYDQLIYFLNSKYNEFRIFSLLTLVAKYKKSHDKKQIIDFYLQNLKFVNNWNLVDLSAPYILGDFVIKNNIDILFNLSISKNLWERRISIVSTWMLIRNGIFEPTLKIAKILIKDNHDLIKKAVGWMLRELGKKDKLLLKTFLIQNKELISKTTFRYATEKFTKNEILELKNLNNN